CRKEIVEIIRNVRNLGLYNDISMTTNGQYLYKKAEDLFNAGLNRINISLSSLKSDMYSKITGSDTLEIVLRGIQKAKEVGFNPIKINYVMLRGLNDNELNDMIDFSAKNGVILQLIELHDKSDAVGIEKQFYDKYHVDLKDIIYSLEKEAIKVKTRGMMQNRKVIFLPNGAIIEVIHPDHEFCMGCTKLRVGCDGNLFGCLYRSDLGKNVKKDLHKNPSLDKFENILKKVIELREPYY
ncbi:MAG: GTP 3',8-cyclase MoaA, partial [Promethearchaeota archaeon]